MQISEKGYEIHTLEGGKKQVGVKLFEFFFLRKRGLKKRNFVYSFLKDSEYDNFFLQVMYNSI